MKILLNDFGGYAFIGQLAQELARIGNEITLTYCSSHTTTPPGIATCAESASHKGILRVLGVKLEKPLNKYSLVQRRRQEIEYGRHVCQAIRENDFDVVFSANTPLDAQRAIWREADRHGIPKVFWMQDILGIAIRRILGRKIPLVGQLIGGHYERIERKILSSSEHVVVISDAFGDFLRRNRLCQGKWSVIQNWAPLDQITLQPKTNAWAHENDCAEQFVFLYSGTLSLKHNPGLLLALAANVESLGAKVVVMSQGKGASWLRSKLLEANSIKNMEIRDYVKIDQLPSVLGASDVLVSILENDASEFSVPSKVLTYVAAGRPVLLSVNSGNLAARLVTSSKSGLVAEPGNEADFLSKAQSLMQNSELRREMGRNARAFAERQFDISRIAGEFQALAAAVVSQN